MISTLIEDVIKFQKPNVLNGTSIHVSFKVIFLQKLEILKAKLGRSPYG